MYRPLLITIITGSSLILSACGGGIESELETSLNNDTERMPICGTFKTYRKVAINGLDNVEMKTYPIKDWVPADSERKEMSNPRGRLCFGNRSVSKIVEFTTPSDFGGMKVTEVVFGYEMELNDLARNLRIDEVIRNAYPKPLQAKAVLIETNKGWRVDKITWAPSNIFAKTKLISSEKYAREERPNCAACQDLVRDGVDFAEISPEVVGQFRNRDHFYQACNSVRQSCASADVHY